MANNADWMPRTLAGKVAMAVNIEGKIAGYAADLGLTPGEVTEIETRMAALVTAYNHKIAAEAGKEATDTWFHNVLYGEPEGNASPNATYLVPLVVTGVSFFNL